MTHYPRHLCLAVCLGFFALRAAGQSAPSGTSPAASEAEASPTVRLAPVEVKTDPFRILGIHGMIVANIIGPTHMYVSSVNPASPSAKNGLHADDEILEIQGKKVSLATLLSFRRILKEALDRGTAVDCVVRSYHRKDSHRVLLLAMPEPRHRWQPLAQAPGVNSPPQDPMPPPTDGAISEKTWQDRGSATPQAALESLFWALGRGDVDRVASLIEVTGESQRVLQSLFATLPAAGRSYYGNPTRLLAALVDQEPRPHWFRIRKASSPDPNSASLVTALQFWNDYDHWRPAITYLFRHTATGWKWAVSNRSIQHYADYYRGVPFELAPPEAVPGIAWFFRSN